MAEKPITGTRSNPDDIQEVVTANIHKTETVLPEDQEATVGSTASEVKTVSIEEGKNLPEWEGNDRTLDKATDHGTVLQEENVVTWRVEGFLSEDGEVLPARKLRKDPPILVVDSLNSDTGETQSNIFVLTEEFSETLGEMGKTVHDAYFGIKPRDRSGSFRDVPGDLAQWAKDHKGSAVFLALFAILVVVGIVFSF